MVERRSLADCFSQIFGTLEEDHLFFFGDGEVGQNRSNWFLWDHPNHPTLAFLQVFFFGCLPEYQGFDPPDVLELWLCFRSLDESIAVLSAVFNSERPRR